MKDDDSMKESDLDYLPVEMPKSGEPKYDIRAINDYCKKHGIDLKKENGLPKEIAEQFITGKDRKD